MKLIDKKRMVFSFFLNNEWKESFVNQLHLRLLKKYIRDFDDVIFCIITDNVDDNNTITSLEKEIVGLNPKNIQFKVYENTNFRESLVFKNEITDKMKELDGLTFFAHNKGISYVETDEGVYKWIVALYYFSLEVGLINFNLNGDCFYGALKSYNISLEDYEEDATGVLPKYGWFYAGTFFWGKYQELYHLLKANGTEIPPMMSRWYDEMFPGNVLEHKWGMTYGRYGADSMIVYDKGQNIDDFILHTYKNDRWVYEDFINFYNNVMKEG